MTDTEPIALNIVSFNNPFPPDLGGLIDVYYRIKQLQKASVQIHLHTFNYDRATNVAELKKVCSSVTFYDRKKTLFNFLSRTPFIVKSRKNKQLLTNLCSNNFPILFEGTHCCAYLNHPKLQNRYRMVRMHNVEGDYYQELAKSESNVLKKFYYACEAYKLKRFDSNLAGASAIATVSENDTKHYKKLNENVVLIPTSHQFDKVTINPGKGDYAFYHGNLSVPENEEAAIYLINKVFGSFGHRLTIAGKNPSTKLIKAASKHENIHIIANPSQSEMEDLVANAHILVLPTFQSTGLKLKLLYSLFRGRFCVVNDQMLAGTQLHAYCSIANTVTEMQNTIAQLMNKTFGSQELKFRQTLETGIYSNKQLVRAWMRVIQNQIPSS